VSNPHEVRTVKCANCGKHRQQTNHWFVTSVEREKFRCAPLDPKRRLRTCEEPACGQQCAQKLFETYLAGRAVLQPAISTREAI
jgi:hypothetical protein